MAARVVDDQPLVSVILPTYNRPELVVTAVESVFDQTYANLEIIVVDDGSDVPVASLLADVPSQSDVKVTLRRHEGNRGANAARNTGIKTATGDYIAFLDDDDYWAPEKTELQLAALQSADDPVAVAFTGQLCVNGSGTITNVNRPVTRGEFLEQLVGGARFGTFSTVMVRADVFDRTGLLDERFPCWQDREWYFRLADHYDFVALPELLTVRRYTDEPQISDDFPTKRDVAYPLMADKHRNRAATLGRRYERQFLAVTARSVAASGINAGYYTDAVKLLARSIRLYPLLPRTYVYLFTAIGGPVSHRLVRDCKRLINRHVLVRD